MTMRRSKQFLYGFFFLAFWGTIFAVVYFSSLRPEPSCFDNIQNQNEEGVDCGGPCEESCLPMGLRPIETVGRILSFRQGGERSIILARASNPNLDYALKNFSYAVILRESGGGAREVARGNSFIYAGEVKYLFVPNVPGLGPFPNLEIKFDGYDWTPASELRGPPRFSVSGITTKEEGGGLVVAGQVLNQDTISFTSVEILALLEGQYDQVAAVSKTEINSIVPNEPRQFSVFLPLIPRVNPAGTKVFVYALRR